MCFSVYSSLIAWFISVTIAYYLWHRNRTVDRWNAAFIFTFSLVQLWEAGIWYKKAYETPTSETSNLFVKLIVLSLLLQPLVQSYFGYLYTKNTTLKWVSVLYLIMLIAGFCYIVNTSYQVTRGPTGHLVWAEKEKGTNSFMPPYTALFYFIGLFIALLFVFKIQWPLLLIGLLTAGWSLYHTQKTGEFGSLWCFTAVAYSITALFM